MAHALGPIVPGELSGLEPVAEQGSEFVYQFDEAENSAVMLETSREKPNFSRSVPLAFAIGAGSKDRAYAASVGAYIWFAPLEVVGTGDQREAALAPAHAQWPGSRFTSPITPECLSCHTDALPPAGYPLHQNPISTGWRPRGLSCKACHGEVEGHADWQESDAPEGTSDPILSLTQMGRTERVSVCAACHLQGDVRIILADARPGVPLPGKDLLESRAVFVAAEPDRDVGFVSHVERLALARCYTETTELDCTTCHSPHRDLSNPAERQRTRASCTNCHGSNSMSTAMDCAQTPELRPQQADCVDCHMRLTDVFDVKKVQVHDHFIQKRLGPPSQFANTRANESPDGNWRQFTWPGETPPEHNRDPGLQLMAFYSRGHTAAALELLEVEPGSAARRLPMYHHARGALFEAVGRLEEAREAYETALELDPATGPSAVNLGATLAQLGHMSEALAVLDEHLARHPASNTGFINRSIVRYQLRDLRGSIEDQESALELWPSADQATTLSELWSELGDREKSVAYTKLASRLENGASR